ncbi:DUF6628 family protein [Qipengyuania sp. 902]|uniref:DUF6628 family protein n=1 Tax=Qipengyuania sp. 902 TaxID=3417565 RepID=UPI003EBE3CA0
MTHRSTAPALDLPLPAHRELSLALVLVRRMAMAGPDDSRAAMLALNVAGSGFRRLLVLARCFVVELARSSRRTLTLAPCCATGMTRDEGLMVDLLRNADLATYAALTEDAPCHRARSAAQALGEELSALAARKGWRGG